LEVRPQAFLLWDSLLLLACEGEAECTGEMAAGQFNIFGAIEEFVATDSHGFSPIKKRVESDCECA
jgi:hypothetical protein